MKIFSPEGGTQTDHGGQGQPDLGAQSTGKEGTMQRAPEICIGTL